MYLSPEYTPESWFIAKFLHTDWVEADMLDRVIEDGMRLWEEKMERVREEESCTIC